MLLGEGVVVRDVCSALRGFLMKDLRFKLPVVTANAYLLV